MFRRVLVANRGEIAVRVMRACRELGIQTIAVYSDADRDAGHVRYADEAYHIGPARASASYLDGENIIETAERADADAIHPGYGFLAENADFAEQVESSTCTWVGPPSDVMRQVGEKTGARAVMQEADVPVVPGTTDPVTQVDEVIAFGDEHGYPIALKAVAGGGGRGMIIVHEGDDIEASLEQAAREGESYFGDDRVYVEKFLGEPSHVEVQILADQHGAVRHLGERDCSLQRRHQKLVEEAPAPGLDAAVREEIGEAARRGLAEVGYTNAGTVEFLVDGDDFYFMEVNTRIQVEHPVTEQITGIDIVKWQLRVAAGEALDFKQSDVSFDGHAIEYRINAEHTGREFSPTPGTLTQYDPPGGIGVRLDDAVREGDNIGGEYDSMIAKVIVKAADRDECIARSDRALQEFAIDGVHTTIPFHRLMLTDDAFLAGRHHTRYVDEGVESDRLEAAVEQWGTGSVADTATAAGERTYTVEVDGKRFDVSILDDEAEQEEQAAPQPRARPDVSEATPAGTAGEQIISEMQGTVLSVAVEEGDQVVPGDVICVVEAMKMENDIVSSGSGTVSELPIAAGETVDMGDVLCVIE